MRKWFIFVLFLTLLFPAVVHAQGAVHFSSVEVEIWPEYDRPDVLVIYRFTLAADVSLPADISLRLPAQAEINAVATSDASGTLLTADYTRQIQGDWQVVSLSTTSSLIQIEYYDSLTFQDTARQYAYQWPGDYAVEALTMYFKLPVDATLFQSDPAMEPRGTRADNLPYYGLEAGAFSAGQELTLNLGYQKTTDRLSTGSQVETVQDLGESANNNFLGQLGQQIQSIFRNLDPAGWISILGGLLLLAGGILAFRHYGRRGNKKTPHKRHAARRETEDTASATVHCHQCGRRAQPGDRFCRACGARLRQDS